MPYKRNRKFSEFLKKNIRRKGKNPTLLYPGLRIWELYDKHFFSKKENLGFLTPDCFIRIKQPEKKVFIFFQPFLEIV